MDPLSRHEVQVSFIMPQFHPGDPRQSVARWHGANRKGAVDKTRLFSRPSFEQLFQARDITREKWDGTELDLLRYGYQSVRPTVPSRVHGFN